MRASLCILRQLFSCRRAIISYQPSVSRIQPSRLLSLSNTLLNPKSNKIQPDDVADAEWRDVPTVLTTYKYAKGRSKYYYYVGVFWNNDDPMNVLKPFTKVGGNMCKALIESVSIALRQAIYDKKLQKVIIKTASKYLIDVVEKYFKFWRENDYKKNNGKHVKHKQELQDLDKLLSLIDARIKPLSRSQSSYVMEELKRQEKEKSEEMAHVLIQDYDGDLYKKLDFYRCQLNSESNSSADSNHDSDVVCLDDDGMEVGELESTSELARPFETFNYELHPYKLPKDITVFSYNVNGLNPKNLKTRFQAFIRNITEIYPEVILLQEVVDAQMEIIKKVMSHMYYVIGPQQNNMPYYNVTLVHKKMACHSLEIKPFLNTTMGRTMSIFEGYWQQLRLVVIHGHLESTQEHAATQKQQFEECLKKMEEYLDSNTLVIFASDMNIHDSELPEINPLIKDAWIAAGSRKKTKYTWDCTKSSNKGRAKNLGYRFDRLYFHGPYSKLKFSLGGTQQIEKALCYPSDHFAIVCKFYNPVKK